MANCVLLLAAGHETTTNLIGNGALALLRHPDQLERLLADPGLIKTAVEELLRFDSPVQATSRLVTEDFQLRGRILQKGQLVLLLLGAANRDPARFPDPDSLNLGRADVHHGAFAFGSHYCLGAPLARLEAQIALPRLFGVFPDLGLATPDVEWCPNFVLRGLKALPVSFSAPPAKSTA
jgi:cytochrome P450